ncbi:MAG TPA: penicillin acylase family protein [Gammaproteobacteria bacterium]|jgi:penicillin amidase
MRKAFRVFGIIAAIALIAIVAAAAWVRHEVISSLPDYSGEVALIGLSEPVIVERDSLGVATIRADNPVDEARALGFVHAQERFFQMDLYRRVAAGELSALFGQVALAADQERRIHGLRATAERVVTSLPASQRALLDAYTAGVNAGLGALESKPFEYLLLQQAPKAWSPVDSMLVIGAMYFDLQDGLARFKRSELVARGVLPGAVVDLLFPRATVWDAPLVGDPGPPAVIPSAETYDLAQLDARQLAALEAGRDDFDPLFTPVAVGSNNWAVAGDRTATGAAILANDPHLGMGTPSIWFRASLDRGQRRITGATLPGIPAVVFGSNGDIAWGLTNSYGDWTDLIVLEPDPADPSRYLSPEGSLPIEVKSSPIEVAGRGSVPFTFETTLFGPVIGQLPDGRRLAVRWVAHETQGYSLEFWRLGGAENATAAMEIAQSSGLPAQNFIVADRAGRVGWTIAGPLPRRLSSGRGTSSAAGPAWDGWLAPEEYPSVVDPGDGLVWTANGRVVEGEMLRAIGDGNYDLGARGGQIRDRLRTLGPDAEPADMLAIQLDDEALFLSRWREALLDLLTAETDPLLVAVREAVARSGDRARVDSVGYRIVRTWRRFMIRRMTAALTAEIEALDSGWTYFSQREESFAWALFDAEPAHLLDPAYDSWPDYKLDSLSDLLNDVLGVRSPAELAGRTWGELNTVRVQHPLSQAVPLLSAWLDMPVMALPGDTDMPRVQTIRFGASARFAVSPGDETNGYFHMPGGQSGHPLSPYYGAGHDDWVQGTPAAFLPGTAEQRLKLLPAGAVD